VEALGEMVGLVTRSQLKSALPRIIPAMLDLYGSFLIYLVKKSQNSLRYLFTLNFCPCRCKKDQEVAFTAAHSLHNLLNVSLLSESGPPLLEFEVT
jgi:hypothetical protein